MRMIVANLDCELAWSRPGAPRALPRDVERRIATLGALLAAFADDGDRLWTVTSVCGGRARLDGAIRAGAAGDVELVSGPLASAAFASPPPAAIAAWGETRDVARLRRRAVRDADTPGGLPDYPVDRPAGLHAGLPADGPAGIAGAALAAHASPDVAARVNDRRFAAALASELPEALPGAAVLGSVAELERHLARGGAGAGHDGAWVLKAPLSASGRLRLRRQGTALDAGSRARARRLFAQFGQLVFEPWMRRVADAGCVGVITDAPGGAAWRLLPPHRLDTDAAGVFRGVTVRGPDNAPRGPAVPDRPDVPDGPGWLLPAERDRLVEVARRAARALADAGYRGPFGVDAYAYTDARGRRALQPLTEINARMTFGLIAHVLRERLGLAHARAVTLCVADRQPWPDPPGPGMIPLIPPIAEDAAAAWLEIEGAPTPG